MVKGNKKKIQYGSARPGLHDKISTNDIDIGVQTVYKGWYPEKILHLTPKYPTREIIAVVEPTTSITSETPIGKKFLEYFVGLNVYIQTSDRFPLDRFILSRADGYLKDPRTQDDRYAIIYHYYYGFILVYDTNAKIERLIHPINQRSEVILDDVIKSLSCYKVTGGLNMDALGTLGDLIGSYYEPNEILYDYYLEFLLTTKIMPLLLNSIDDFEATNRFRSYTKNIITLAKGGRAILTEDEMSAEKYQKIANLFKKPKYTFLLELLINRLSN